MSDEPSVRPTLGVRIQRTLLPTVAAWLGLAATGVFMVLRPDLAGATFYPLSFALFALLHLYYGIRTPLGLDRAPRPDVEITPDRVALVGEGFDARIARRSLTDGWIESFKGEHRVALRKKGGDVVWIRVAGHEAGVALLEALGLGADRHLLRVPLVSRYFERFSHTARDLIAFALCIPLLILGGMTIAAAHAPGLALGLAVAGWLACAYKVLQWVTPRRAVIGVDGVTIRGLGTQRFVPFDSVRRAKADERGVQLELTSGEEVLLSTAPNPGRPRLDPTPNPTGQALWDRMRQAVEAGRLGTDDDSRFAILDRAGRSLEAWRAELAALGAGKASNATYRNAALDRDELLRVVRDGSAPAERRIGAALAIGASGEASFRKDLRIAVDTCSNERLRIALTKAAEGQVDEDEVAAAAEQEQEQAATARR